VVRTYFDFLSRNWVRASFQNKQWY
jgi:hypothetical protein